MGDQVFAPCYPLCHHWSLAYTSLDFPTLPYPSGGGGPIGRATWLGIEERCSDGHFLSPLTTTGFGAAGGSLSLSQCYCSRGCCSLCWPWSTATHQRFQIIPLRPLKGRRSRGLRLEGEEPRSPQISQESLRPRWSQPGSSLSLGSVCDASMGSGWRHLDWVSLAGGQESWDVGWRPVLA